MAKINSSPCPVCSGDMQFVFSAKVLQKYLADYECCGDCGFLRVGNPHWLDEAYSSAVADADTGLVVRNISLANRLASLLFWSGERGQGRYLDSAGGYGMLVRLMRDYGFDFYWSDKYCENILARGFEYERMRGGCSAATAMEVLEHVTDPVAYVAGVLNDSCTDTLIFTTELYEGAPPKADEWWYYALPTGQHIGFFQRRTLAALSDKLRLNFYSANGIHILSKRKLSGLWLMLVTNSYFVKFTVPFIRRLIKSKTMSDHKKLLGSSELP